MPPGLRRCVESSMADVRLWARKGCCGAATVCTAVSVHGKTFNLLLPTHVVARLVVCRPAGRSLESYAACDE